MRASIESAKFDDEPGELAHVEMTPADFRRIAALVLAE